MTDYYRINVSQNGKYLFATEGGNTSYGITRKKEAEKIINLFKEKFTTKKGYKISVIYYECTGKIIEI